MRRGEKVFKPGRWKRREEMRVGAGREERKEDERSFIEERRRDRR